MVTVAAPGSTSALAEQLREREQRQQELAAGRARDRVAERAPAMGGLDGEDIAAVNDPLRVARRLDRVSRFLTGRDPDSVPSDAPPAALVADAAARLALPQAPEVLLERVINQPDFLAVRYLEGGHVAQRTVGRVVIRGSDGRVAGYGTGFLVSAHLLLTNHHVLPSAEVAAASVVELDFQRSLGGSLLPVVELPLAPDRFFVADETLDFALVEVVGAPGSTAPFGWCRLTDAQGTVVVGESVTIVQHPRGREKEVVLRENKLVDIPEQVLHYLTDTEPGSSGSPVFNDQWEVIALHHASVPSGTAGESPGYLNEGIRISRILRHLREAGLDGERRARVEALGTAPSPHGGRPTTGTETAPQPTAEPDAESPTAPAPAPTGASPTAPAPAPAPVTVEIPLRLTVSLALGDAAPTAPPVVRVDPAAQDGVVAPGPAVEALAVDPDYSTRGGYDPAFLGVPLPLPGAGSNAAVASAELRYHHFSVVMHRARRLALLTAVNIDGGATDAQPRSDDRWILDPRLPRSEQTGADVYADNHLDRGHLVRRLDPAWGPLSRAANDDTFHYTNSAPQHHAFNAGSTLWLGLEEYVLGTARRDRLRVSVVSGPVLAPDDPPYRGTLLPRQFFKVVAVVDDRDRLVVTGYVLGQDSFLPSVLTEAAFGAYRTFQVRVATIAARTGLDLGAYAAADPLGSQEAAVAAHALRSYADIVLGA